MQTSVSANYLNTLKQDVSLSAKSRLIAEWNQNRFAGPATVVCPGYPYATSDEFPIESVVLPNRPEQDGLLKARASSRSAIYTDGQEAEGYVQSQYDTSTAARAQRSYTVSANSKYKYWSSPTRSSAALVGGKYTMTAGNSLEVTYTKAVWMNKVVATFEASVTVPADITIAYKTTQNGSWTTWAGSHTVGSTGRLDLYRQADGTISPTEFFEAPTQIWGLKVTVGSLSRPNARLNIIEISARLASDISTYLVEFSNGMSMSDVSMVTPLGVCSSNTVDVTLDNIDGRFDTDRATLRDSAVTNIYYGIIDKNVKMTLDFGLLVNGSYEYTRMFTMWVDEWNTQNEITAEVSLKDSSKFLQETKPLSILYTGTTSKAVAGEGFTTTGLSAAHAVWRLCDSVGFNNYVIDTAAMSDKLSMDYFWTDPEKTVWDHLQEIAESTQTAIFFDEYDRLRVYSRESAYDITKPVSWIFDAEEPNKRDNTGRTAGDALKLPDVIKAEQTYDFEANTVNVKYLPTSVSEMVSGVAKMEAVWEPEGTVTLRGTRLVQTFTSTDQFFKVTPTEAVLWPYTGIVQIENEFIKYTKKGYTYRNAAGTWVTAYIENEDERKKKDAESPAGMAFANYFNGYFFCGTTGRGQWGTTAKNHYVDITGWVGRYRYLASGPVRTWSGGMVHNKNNGTMQLTTNKTFTPNGWYVVSTGLSTDVAPIYYGTRLRMPTTGYSYGAAGIAMNLGTNDQGYYVEIVRTGAISANDRAKYTNELVFYKRDVNGVIKRLGTNNGKGIPVEILRNKWYDLDVKLTQEGSNHAVSISLNGRVMMTVIVAPANQPTATLQGRFGMFNRGWTIAEFEYMYATTTAVNSTFDQPGWFNQITGGWQSSQLQHEWVYQRRTTTLLRRNKPPLEIIQRYNTLFFDEFGPVVHEVREFDVTFDKKPVIHSNLYLSNESQVICPEYIGTPFGAKFVLANMARRNVIAHGEDTVTFGADNPVEQKLMIYGRLIERGEEQTVKKQNASAVNMRGVVEVDVASSWIQNKASAEAIADWISYHWGGGTDEVIIESFGNPLLQIGDLVAVHDPDNSMLMSTHKYFIVGIDHSFNGSLSTSFTLRRAKS